MIRLEDLQPNSSVRGILPDSLVLGAKADLARELAYRLYIVCERKKRAPGALAYNALVWSWPAITRLAHDHRAAVPRQADFLEASTAPTTVSPDGRPGRG